MAGSKHVSWRFGVPPDGRPRSAGHEVTWCALRVGWAPNYGPVRPTTPKCKADASAGIAPERISALSAKMSLETLLEAARYLEYRAQAQTRGEIPKDFGAFSSSSPTSVPSTSSTPILILREESPVAGSSQSAAAQELRRRVGSGTREVHNKLEKNRRAHLKECFELLKKQLPAAQDEKKSSNLSILHSALRYIQSLKRKERDYEHEMERLAREKIASQQRLSALKKELSAQWDHIDFNALLPADSLLQEVDRVKSRTSNSTSTASEQGHTSEDAEDASFPILRCDKCHVGSTPPHSSAGQSPSSPHHETCAATQVMRGAAPPVLSNAVVSPVHITSNHQRHCQLTPSPNLSPSPILLGPQQPMALTVQHHHSSLVLPKFHEHDAKMVSSSTSTNVAVPTIHVASGQHPVAYLSPPNPAQGELSHDGGIPSPGKFSAHHISPTVAITGGSIALTNGVVASAAVSLASSQSGRPITPTSGENTGLLSTAVHGSTPVSALPTHLTPAGITHLVAPIRGHAALVTASGAATHSLMAPLALVSSTGRPVAAHILGSSTSAPGAVSGKVMASGTAGALPLLKPVAVGGQLPLMNAQYLTTATALGGLAHLVKPLVVVSSAPSNHSSSTKLPLSPPQ